MAGFKSATAKIINGKQNQPGEKIWQDNYYDRIIRNENELNKIRQYIIDNPFKCLPAIAYGIRRWQAGALDENNPNNFKSYE